MTYLDQHFLYDEKILEKISSLANYSKNDIVLEIGAGTGALTKNLINKKISKLIIVEKDYTLIEKLKELEQNNIEIICGDGIDFLKNSSNVSKVIANIPYSITEPIYKTLIDKKINECVLLHGKTFYTTIIERSNSKWYYFIRSFYEICYTEDVPGNLFEPNTKVTSIILHLKLKNNLDIEDKIYQKLYENSDRKVLNAVMYSFVDVLKLPKKQIKAFIKDTMSNIVLEKKMSQISNLEFKEIVNCVEKKDEI